MITISKKEDIIIPFEKIGEPKWEIKTKEIIESLAENWGKTLPSPKTDKEMDALEQRLHTTLPEGLKLFYKTFGIADIGEELQQFDEMIWLKDLPVEQETTEEEKQYVPFLVTFSDYLGNGNMFCFHTETKEVYYYDHDTFPYIVKLFDTVDQYIQGCLIFAQSDLFSDINLQEEIDNWTEEIVSGMYGNSVVKKWRY